MSVRAITMCWDLKCPATYNNVEIKPGHKFVLVAYADHADHNGRSIYPAVETVASKTGYDERSVQRLTRDLEQAGILILEGKGPRGTNKYYIPIKNDKISPRGDILSPLTNYQGDIPSGDIPSGDIPSGDKMPPEKIKEPGNISIGIQIWSKVLATLKTEMPRASYDTWVASAKAGSFDGHHLQVLTHNSYAVSWLTSRIKERAEMLAGVNVTFVYPGFVDAENEDA